MRLSLFIIFSFLCLSNTKSQAKADPIFKFNQPSILTENSGAIFWNNLLWQHNDGGGDAAIYGLDTTANTVIRRVTIKNGFNIDWEDIAQDVKFIYIGDFGNNLNGGRPKFTIYKIAKSDIENTSGNVSVTAEIIHFTYEDQPAVPVIGASNATNFDCEAMIALDEKLFLFTKQWNGNKTILYELNNSSKIQVAKIKDSLVVDGLITGADISPAKKRVVLTGYTKTGIRFMYLLHDFKGFDLFKGLNQKVLLSGLTQTESVAFINEEYIYLGSEAFLGYKPRLEMLNINKYFINKVK
jgi:hypothetical protein